MPKSKTQKYYAVLIGRNGPQVYDNWDECKNKVSRYPGAVHKSFKNREEAERWLGSQPRSEPRTHLPGSPAPVLKNQKSTPDKGTHTPVAANPTNLDAGSGGALLKDKTPVILSPEQRKVLAAVQAGQNVLFTGSAGTGKSVLLREIIDFCGGVESTGVAITAPTGIAAINIGGCTMHSWAGIGIGDETATKFVGRMRGLHKIDVISRWKDVRTLIIDEISMLDGGLFEKLEAIARIMRDSQRPFGGIQLVLCGDFCQLPPISGKDAKGREMPARFAFEASTWNRCVGKPMMLTKVFRQKDQHFVDMLNEMRFGRMSEDTIHVFERLSRQVDYDDGIEPTGIYSMRYEVQNANQSRLDQLPGPAETYTAYDVAGVDSEGKRVSEKRKEQLLEKLVCQKSVTLKVGAQVMLIKNLVQGKLVNGSVGKIIKFGTLTEVANDGAPVGEPKSDETKVFQSDAPKNSLPSRLWPVVRFINGIERVIVPVEFDLNNADGKMEARRVQVPLILAWALSVHKSQGQTLERVKVDLRRTFEKGQAYVALSRATSIEHLQVLNFDAGKVMAHPRVLAWYGVDLPRNDEFDEDMDDEEAMRSYYE